jgi:SARP family transcriptional regulator, regulator of embCAB operon
VPIAADFKRRHVQHERIRSAATLHDGDHIRICDHEFTFQIAAGNKNEG